MHVKGIAAGPLGTNCYIIHNDREALIVDPGGDPEKIVTYLTEADIEPKAILLTHAHFDHIGGVEQLRTDYHLDVYVHAEEDSWLENPELNGSSSFLSHNIITARADYKLSPGRVQIGTITFDVMHTPGHSPGSVSFIFSDDRFVLGGDVLFNQGVGRTDLPGGDWKQLARTIRDMMYHLSDDFTVYPGHGPATTIGGEKQHNPFLQA